MKATSVLAAVAVLATPAQAALPPSVLDAVGVAPPRDAALPHDLRFTAAGGRSAPLLDDGGATPRILVFADYACTTLCGPALTIVANRLRETGLTSGADYRLDIVGLDPRSTPQEAQAFGRDRAPAGMTLRLLTGDEGTIKRATAALGYRYVYDRDTRSFAHPVAAFVLTGDGRLSRALSEVSLTAGDLKAAIAEARAGSAPGIVQMVAIACHAALAAAGRFDGAALAVLRIGATATVLMGGAGLIFLARRRRAAA